MCDTYKERKKKERKKEKGLTGETHIYSIGCLSINKMAIPAITKTLC
jgi:hypothetical protein